MFVDKNPPGKRADEGGNAWIRNIDENGIQVQFTIDGRRRLVSPRRILRDANIDTLARQRACDNLPRPSLLSIHHASKRHNNRLAEKRTMQQETRPVYKFLLLSQNWSSNRNISKHPMLTYLREGRENVLGWAFETYPIEKLSMAFIQNEQVACAILEDNGGNEHTKEKGAMHFNIRKTCIAWYADEGEASDIAPNEDESGNVRVRKAIGVHMIEEYETNELPTIKQGQKLKYPLPDTSGYDTSEIKTYLTDDELDFIYNEAMKVVNNGNLLDGYNWDFFGRIYCAVESEGGEFIDS